MNDLTENFDLLSAETPELASHSSHLSSHVFDPITGLDTTSTKDEYVSPCGCWKGNSVDTFEWLDLNEKAKDMFYGKFSTRLFSDEQRVLTTSSRKRRHVLSHHTLKHPCRYQ